MQADDGPLMDTVTRCARPMRGERDLDPLIEQIGSARVVMLGEASHGTSEYYSWRARLSRRLIDEGGFSFVAVEGDWPDCFRLNRYVRDLAQDDRAADVVRTFERWPTWMWANWEVVGFLEWLREHNAQRAASQRAGFYGLDVYSLHASMARVVSYLEQQDGHAAERARTAWRCFEPFGQDATAYARSTALVPADCEDEVLGLLRAALKTTAEDDDPEAALDAEQNAWVSVGAERYYRTMMRGDGHSWNIRDRHMAATLDRLLEHHGSDARAIIWAHNTHVGDARATPMAGAGMVNIGQLGRETYGRQDCCLVGFASHRGSVIAGRAWGASMETMELPRAVDGSWEALLHGALEHDALLLTPELVQGDGTRVRAPRGHRAVGVVYHPSREGANYVPTVLPERYDALVFIDESHALHPLHLEAHAEGPPDTYPWGI